jgi:signal recognition particle subunit SRP54
MFETLTKGFRAARQRLSGLTELTEANIEQALRDVRLSLLEADVEFNVVKRFLDTVKQKAVGDVIQNAAVIQGQKVKVSAADRFIKVCHDELVDMMSVEGEPLALNAKPALTGIMMVGLQGSGKTTTTGKLALLLQKDGYKPLLVAADVQRPGAIEQLQVLGERISVPVFAIPGGDPLDICKKGRDEARKQKCDVVIYDTAGRLAVDEVLMNELGHIKAEVKPENVLLVVDSMIGQDSVKTARAFHDKLSITGVVLTKLDGDARGGAALSIKEVTGAPVRFAGMGEGLDKLEPFRPEGMASRILGFGDVVGLMKDFEGVIDEEKAQKEAAKMLQGRFSLNDFLDQIRMIKQMGPLKDLFEKLPFFPDGMPEGASFDDGELIKAEAIVSSMTKQERVETELFKRQPTRIVRVARGSGRSEREVAELIERFTMMRNMMGGIGQSAGLLSKIPGMQKLAGMKRMRDAVRMGGLENMGMPGMGGMADELLESLVAQGGPFGGGGFPGMPGMPGMPGAPGVRKKESSLDKQKKKNLRKQQKKSRKKGR